MALQLMEVNMEVLMEEEPMVHTELMGGMVDMVDMGMGMANLKQDPL